MLWLLCSAPAFAGPVTLNAEDWARPRSGEALARMTALAETMGAFEREMEKGVIVISHSADEAGQLWAGDLRSWLIALGVSSARIKLESRVDVQGVLILDVIAREKL